MSALTSTDRLETTVFMRDGLRVVDQFGQKAAGGGNYKITISAEAGANEIQKSDIMMVKHDVFEGHATANTVRAGLKATYGVVTSGGVRILNTGNGVNFTFALTGTDSSISGVGFAAGVISIKVNVKTGTTLDELYEFLKSEMPKHKISGAAGLSTIQGRNLGDIVFVSRDLSTSSWASGFTVASQLTTTAVGQGYGSRVGMVAQEFTRLRDISKFWDASGNFTLEQPQKINLTQGNGEKSTISLFDQDTVQSVTDKLNKAIYIDLKQSVVASSSLSENFVTYVANPKSGADIKSVKGTWIISSAIAGSDGRIAFSGSDDVLNALSLQNVQDAKENIFTVNVVDAHTNEMIANNVRFSGNMLIGAIHPNVDVKFDSNADIVATNDADKGFLLSSVAGTNYETFVHIADRTMVLHVGANQKQDIGVGIANMSASALGVDNLLVTDNNRANESMGKLDSAINMVSSERAKLGAVQNRLDHTIANLTTSSENLTAAESRIRDVDMAKEMMNFTRYQVLVNAATSMLAQANQMPQTVLTLLR